MNNTSYIVAVLLPLFFFGGSMGYISTFEVPLVSQIQFSSNNSVEEVEAPPLPDVWEKVKDKQKPVAKDLILTLTELQKESDLMADSEKVYDLQELEKLNIKMGEQVYRLPKLEGYFYFPPSTMEKEVVTLDDIEVLGIFYGRANIRVAEENKERLVQVGEKLKKGKVIVEEIHSDVVVFSVEGKKVVKAIKK